jgi:hypothetical protein
MVFVINLFSLFGTAVVAASCWPAGAVFTMLPGRWVSRLQYYVDNIANY